MYYQFSSNADSTIQLEIKYRLQNSIMKFSSLPIVSVSSRKLQVIKKYRINSCCIHN